MMNELPVLALLAARGLLLVLFARLRSSIVDCEMGIDLRDRPAPRRV